MIIFIVFFFFLLIYLIIFYCRFKHCLILLFIITFKSLSFVSFMCNFFLFIMYILSRLLLLFVPVQINLCPPLVADAGFGYNYIIYVLFL